VSPSHSHHRVKNRLLQQARFFTKLTAAITVDRERRQVMIDAALAPNIEVKFSAASGAGRVIFACQLWPK
jgi:hypothetical protein